MSFFEWFVSGALFLIVIFLYGIYDQVDKSRQFLAMLVDIGRR